MDTYSEQLVKKCENSSDQMKKIGIIVGGIAVILILLFVTIYIMPIAIIAACGAAYGAYWLLTCQNVEYEYTVTNGSIDIDKIIARRKRVSMISVDVKDFTDFGDYRQANDNFRGTTVMAMGDEEEPYFADFHSEKYGETRLVFSPNEKVLNCIKPYLPRTLK
ncbi:hypothetical protein [Porcipelethomonas sp.]|uniref:hypothetical protein n=1 Tax=Porcipelethomonas sp. TaxID=2981675 RepID=UPI003EFA727B